MIQFNMPRKFGFPFKKIRSKCKLQFLAKNLRKSLALNGLRLV